MSLPNSILDNREPPGVPACRVKSDMNQASPSIITFETEVYDTDQMHDNVVNNSRITIQTAGKYHYGANILWSAPGAAGTVDMEVLLNAATILNADRKEF